MFAPALLTFCLAAVASASAVPRSLKRESLGLVTSCTVPNTVAITFDDGPWQYTHDVVDALNAAGAKGTFFLNGNNFECIYEEQQQERVRYIHNSGHQLASHTWSHSDMSTLSYDQLHDELWRIEDAFSKIVGVVPGFVRPPYGNHNQLSVDVATQRHQTTVIWDFDSEDSIGASAEESKALYDKVISEHPGTILTLNHEVYETTAKDVLPYAIQQLQAAGYNLVTVAECLGAEPYQSVGEPQQGNWSC